MRTAAPAVPPLAHHCDADVCVVGAGIAGLSTAYHLARAGKSVVVLDDGPVARGQTCRTTAHLTRVLDEGYAQLEKLHGPAAAKLAAESHGGAIERIREIVEREGIDCDLDEVDGYLFNPPGDSPSALADEMKAARRAGLEVELLSRAPMDFFDTGPCLRFPHQGQFHPIKYLAGVTRAILAMGGQIFSRAHVVRVKGGEPAFVETRRGHTVTASAVLVATHTPVNDRVTMHAKQAAYRSYVIGAHVPKGSVTRALYWDNADPYHYVRIKSNGTRGDLLIVGGEDHKTGQMPQTHPYRQLEAWASRHFPMMQAVEYRWSGQIMEPIDGLSFIGRNPGDEPNIYIATGDSGNGMTYGTITGMLISDLILGRDNPWIDLYDPSRKRILSAGEFMRENINVAVQYGDWLTQGDVPSKERIKPGCGAVLRNGFAKLAVYRDETRRFHQFSAVCPHLGCVVAWNDTEQTWDCPCHGSRFDKLGKVIHGPAMSNLAPMRPQKGPQQPSRTVRTDQRADVRAAT